jgi:hypothetical protein
MKSALFYTNEACSRPLLVFNENGPRCELAIAKATENSVPVSGDWVTRPWTSREEVGGAFGGGKCVAS